MAVAYLAAAAGAGTMAWRRPLFNNFSSKRDALLAQQRGPACQDLDLSFMIKKYCRLCN